MKESHTPSTSWLGTSSCGHNATFSQYMCWTDWTKEWRPPPVGSTDMKRLWVNRGRLLCLRRGLSLPNISVKQEGCASPRVAQVMPVHLHSRSSAPSSHQKHQGGQMLSPSSGPILAEPVLVPPRWFSYCQQCLTTVKCPYNRSCWVRGIPHPFRFANHAPMAAIQFVGTAL